MGFGRTIYQDIYREDGSGCVLDYEKHTRKKLGVLYRNTYLQLEKKGNVFLNVLNR